MSITDELRNEVFYAPMEPDQRGRFNAIANRIDAAHEEALINSYFDGVFSDEELAENGWVRLPKDADGEYIHIGDWMENGERVERIVLTDGSWEPYVYLAKTPYVLHEYFCNEISHHKQPTVEDVLRDMHAKLDEVTALYVGEAIDSDERDRDEARIFAEYTSKLRLAGEGE